MEDNCTPSQRWDARGSPAPNPANKNAERKPKIAWFWKSYQDRDDGVVAWMKNNVIKAEIAMIQNTQIRIRTLRHRIIQHSNQTFH